MSNRKPFTVRVKETTVEYKTYRVFVDPASAAGLTGEALDDALADMAEDECDAGRRELIDSDGGWGGRR